MTLQEKAIYADSVLEQKEAIARIYGNVDFSILPERYVGDADISKIKGSRYRRYAKSALSDPARVETIRNYTMTGDRVADAYAKEDESVEIIIDWGGPVGVRIGRDSNDTSWHAVQDSIEMTIENKRVSGTASFATSSYSTNAVAQGSFDIECGY